MGSLTVPIGVVLFAVLAATVTDLRSFRIYNILTLPLLATGLGYHAYVGGSEGLNESAEGAMFGFCILLVFYVMGGMGGGDVKLMAGIGAWLGLPITAIVLILACLATGAYSLILIVASGQVRQTWARLELMCHRIMAFGRHITDEDQLEAAVQSNTRRKRLVPFASMTMVGLVVLLAWAKLRFVR